MTESRDPNDILREGGPDALRAYADGAKPYQREPDQARNGGDKSEFRTKERPSGPNTEWSFHCDEDPTPTAWLIKYILPEIGAGLISGQWGSYKTTVALDIAVAVMTGTLFANRYKVKRPGGVAYFALEGAGGLASRLTAIARTRGFTESQPFAFRSDCPALTAADALEKLTIMVEQVSSQIREKFNIPTVLIFIDTVVVAAAYTKSGDENDNAVNQRIMSVLSNLAQRTGLRVIGIDHFGKVTETGTRGASAKEAHADVVLATLADRELSGSLSNTRLAVRKLREGVSGLELPFTPQTLQVGTDADGDPITRVVIDWAPPAGTSTSKGWAKSLQLLQRILMMLLVNGRDMQPFLDGPTVRTLTVKQVRTEFYKQHPSQKLTTQRQAFNRVLKDAQNAGVVMVREIDGTKQIWLARKEAGPQGNPL